jgi:hypothetical protein
MLGFFSWIMLAFSHKKCNPLQDLRLRFCRNRRMIPNFSIFWIYVCLPSSGSLGDVVGVVVLLCLRDNGGSVLCEPNLQKESAKMICWCGFDFLADFYLVWDVT